jgi:hypothetical protein
MIGGVEANCVIHFGGTNYNGVVQVSWDQGLFNEFRIKGSKAEVIVKPMDLKNVLIKTDGIFRPATPSIKFHKTLENKNINLGAPKLYNDCIFYQLIQMLRAIVLDEKVTVTAEEGRQVISIIEKSSVHADPIEMNWLPDSEQKHYKKMHRSNIL